MHGAPNPVIGGGLYPRSPGSAAYHWELENQLPSIEARGQTTWLILTLILDKMTYDLVFQFPTSCAKIKVKGQLIQKAKMKTIKVG